MSPSKKSANALFHIIFETPHAKSAHLPHQSRRCSLGKTGGADVGYKARIGGPGKAGLGIRLKKELSFAGGNTDPVILAALKRRRAVKERNPFAIGRPCGKTSTSDVFRFVCVYVIETRGSDSNQPS